MDVLLSASEGLQGSIIELLPENHATDLGCDDDIILLGDNPHGMQVISKHLVFEATKCDVGFAP